MLRCRSPLMTGKIRVRSCIINWRLAALTQTHTPNNCSCARAPDSYGRQNIPHWTLSCAHQTYCTPSRTLHLRSISILSSNLNLRAQCNFLSSGFPRKNFTLGSIMRATRPVNIMKINKTLQMLICSVVYPLQYAVWWPTDPSQRPPAPVCCNRHRKQVPSVYQSSSWHIKIPLCIDIIMCTYELHCIPSFPDMQISTDCVGTRLIMPYCLRLVLPI